MVKALLFDLDDTVIIDDPATRETFLAVSRHAAAKADLDPTALAARAQSLCVQLWKESVMYSFCHSIGIHGYECAWGNFAGPDPRYTELDQWTKGFRTDLWDHALRTQGTGDRALAQELGELYGVERRQRIQLMPDALEVLRALRADYPLALLTNGAPSLQREKINALDLEPEFDAITISGELGIGKPRPQIFHATAEKLGVAPEDCVMIGNSLERDIVGGAGAGMRTIHLSIPGAREEGIGTPDATIRELREIPALLAGL